MATYFDVPFTRFLGDLNLKKIIIISTAGITPQNWDRKENEEFILIPSDTPTSELEISHRHFNTGILENDLNPVFPADRLRELQDEGRIGGPTERHVSVFGFHLLQSRVKREIAPKIAEIADAEEAGAALFVAGCVVCHRTAQGIQHVVEEYGIPTVMITQHPAVTRMGHPPRAFYPMGFRPGHAVGLPNQPELQRQVIMDALQLLTTLEEPGLVVEKSYADFATV